MTVIIPVGFGDTRFQYPGSYIGDKTQPAPANLVYRSRIPKPLTFVVLDEGKLDGAHVRRQTTTVYKRQGKTLVCINKAFAVASRTIRQGFNTKYSHQLMQLTEKEFAEAKRLLPQHPEIRRTIE